MKCLDCFSLWSPVNTGFHYPTFDLTWFAWLICMLRIVLSWLDHDEQGIICWKMHYLSRLLHWQFRKNHAHLNSEHNHWFPIEIKLILKTVFFYFKIIYVHSNVLTTTTITFQIDMKTYQASFHHSNKYYPLNNTMMLFVLETMNLFEKYYSNSINRWIFTI